MEMRVMKFREGMEMKMKGERKDWEEMRKKEKRKERMNERKESIGVTKSL